jgi:hypothetical protein
VTNLYASIGCLLLNDWLLTMVKINSVKNRQFVVYDTGIVYIMAMRVVRQRVVRQSCETRCVVSNRMSDCYVRYRMFVTIFEFCVIYVFWTLLVCVQQIGTV